MTFSATDTGYHVLLQRNDELVRCLIQFARAEEIDTAVISGFGSVSEVELGTGSARHREHHRRQLIEPLEVCSLNGTLTLVDGEPFPHLHGSFARADCSLIGGHVYAAVCATGLYLALQLASGAHATHFARSFTAIRTIP